MTCPWRLPTDNPYLIGPTWTDGKSSTNQRWELRWASVFPKGFFMLLEATKAAFLRCVFPDFFGGLVWHVIPVQKYYRVWFSVQTPSKWQISFLFHAYGAKREKVSVDALAVLVKLAENAKASVMEVYPPAPSALLEAWETASTRKEKWLDRRRKSLQCGARLNIIEDCSILFLRNRMDIVQIGSRKP